jgi:hypothetical protein
MSIDSKENTSPKENAMTIRTIPKHFEARFVLQYDFSFKLYKVYEKMNGGGVQLIAGFPTFSQAVRCMEQNE